MWSGCSKQQRLIADDFLELIKQGRLFASGTKEEVDERREQRCAPLSLVCCAVALCLHPPFCLFTSLSSFSSLHSPLSRLVYLAASCQFNTKRWRLYPQHCCFYIYKNYLPSNKKAHRDLGHSSSRTLAFTKDFEEERKSIQN